MFVTYNFLVGIGIIADISMIILVNHNKGN